MDRSHDRLAACGHFLHRYFLAILLGVYATAAVAPASGRWAASLGISAKVMGAEWRLSAPAAMLGVLLFAAGLNVRSEYLRGLLRRPTTLVLGFLSSLIVPVLMVVAVGQLLSYWHSPVEARDVVLGLAVVAAMPVAGSSAAWTRSADGDAALSLGLILLSTLLSPFTTPLAFGITGAFDLGPASSELGRLSRAGGASEFLVAWVFVPTVLGIACRGMVGGTRADAAGPWMKLITSLVLMMLCYVNATTCLPGAVADPDLDFLLLVLTAVTLTSSTAFLTGFAVAKVVGAGSAQKAALVYGVGMANNGTGLSLAAGTLTACPMALLPLVAVNLVQHLIAGVANWSLRTRLWVRP
jgi:BASS family bile acid:Na+ symporter